MAEVWTEITNPDDSISYKVENTVEVRRVTEEGLQEEKTSLQAEITRLQARITDIDADLTQIAAM